MGKELAKIKVKTSEEERRRFTSNVKASLVDQETYEDLSIEEFINADTMEAFSNYINEQNIPVQVAMRTAYLAGIGLNTSEVIEATGFDKEYVVAVKKSPVFVQAKKLVQEQITVAAEDMLRAGSVKAAATLIDKMDSSNEKVAVNAANSVLDRVGIRAPKEVNVTTDTATAAVKEMSIEELMEIAGKQVIDLDSDIAGDGPAGTFETKSEVGLLRVCETCSGEELNAGETAPGVDGVYNDGAGELGDTWDNGD